MTIKMKITKCLNCQINEAQYVEPYGYLPCTQCQDRHRKEAIKETIELTTDNIREERKAYHDDIVQKYRGHVASREYIRRYGKKGFTPEEVKNAKEVWHENNYYREGDKIA